jgi:chromosome partitioning protein
MKEAIAVINQKGGVGKSTTALAIGQGLFLKGYKVLFIDLDAQGNLSYSVDIALNSKSILDVLTGKADVKEVIQHTEAGDILPSDLLLSGADLLLTEMGKEYKLKEAIEPLKEVYDYIIIDTPPALGILTVNALTACTGVIIPAQADIYSLQGIGQLSNTINAVRKYCNKDLQLKGIVLTRYNKRAVLSRDVAELLEQTAQTLKTKLYKTHIREAVAVKEAQIKKACLFTYAPKSNASIDYKNLISEVIAND